MTPCRSGLSQDTLIPVLAGEQLAKAKQWKIGQSLTLNYQDQQEQHSLQVEIKGIVATGGNEE